VFSQLASEGLGPSDVLWVRFGAEDETFDYEKLARFTYHNCFNEESSELVDKYVKGQEFPVVVIEGFPRDLETSDWRESEQTEAERRMWKARRELYLCCSRSTCFLHFIHPQGGDGSSRGPADEVAEIVSRLSHPVDYDAICKRVWRFCFRSAGIARPVPAYTDEAVEMEQPLQDLKAISMNRPVTAKALATALGLQASALVDPLSELGFTIRTVKDLVPDSIAKELALKLGTILEVTMEEMPSEGDMPPASEDKSHASIKSDSDSANRGDRMSPAPPAPQTAHETKDDFEIALLQFVRAWAFRGLGSKVERYLALLTWFLARKPETKAVLLRHDRGRMRKYFATTKEEIDRHANSANAKPIGATGLWALGTTSTDLKRSVLNDVMIGLGISLPTRQEVLREF
jgi:negative regulator of replication initiation